MAHFGFRSGFWDAGFRQNPAATSLVFRLFYGPEPYFHSGPESIPVGQDESCMVRTSSHREKKVRTSSHRERKGVDIRQTKMSESPYVQHSRAGTARVARANERWRREHTRGKE